MKKWGIDPAKVFFIAGITSYNKLIALAETLTVDKYGGQATILTGELGRIYGVPIIVSEKIRQDLNDTGVYDATTTDKTLLMCVYKGGFMLGTRGTAKLTFVEDAQVDQNQLIVSFRKAFIDRYDATAANNEIVSLGYKIS